MQGTKKSKYGKTYVLLITTNKIEDDYDDRTALSNADKLKHKGFLDEIYGCKLPEKKDQVPDRKLLGDFNDPQVIDSPVNELSDLDGNDRLYIVGHGTYGENPTLGGKTPNQLAVYLYDNGLRHIKVISLVSCNSGWGLKTDSFAKLFTDQLNWIGIHAEIRARIGYVTVLKSGRKIVEFKDGKSLMNYIYAPKKWNKCFWHS